LDTQVIIYLSRPYYSQSILLDQSFAILDKWYFCLSSNWISSYFSASKLYQEQIIFFDSHHFSHNSPENSHYFHQSLYARVFLDFLITEFS